jgi:hypothetical protein
MLIFMITPAWKEWEGLRSQIRSETQGQTQNSTPRSHFNPQFNADRRRRSMQAKDQTHRGTGETRRGTPKVKSARISDDALRMASPQHSQFCKFKQKTLSSQFGEQCNGGWRAIS